MQVSLPQIPPPQFLAYVKFVFSKKATKFEKIFTYDLTHTTKCQIDGEDFVNFCGLLRKHELYGTKIRLLWNDSTTNLWN